MYNGIGLSTPRGSGTNGYVVRNLSFVKAPRPDRNLDRSVNDLKSPAPAIKQPNKDILLHDRKRKVEVKCMELRIKLEDEEVDADTIETKVQELRESLMNNFEDIQPRDAKR
ncbi:cwf21-domain-containing protein [Lichtheimia hyalospora FSU 10163]|nr:cwf21-domain-containing protein [Lichtheimia hyalospora FSU 10163]